MNKRNHIKSILIVTPWAYEDALIQTYTLPYVKLIRKKISENEIIYLTTFETKDNIFSEKGKQIRNELFSNYKIKVIPFKYYHLSIRSLPSYIFLIFRLTYITFFKRVTHIHAWCTTGGMWAYIISILTRKPLILDSFEPHAEPMIESGTWTKNGIAFRTLFYFEKKQLLRANKVIVCVEKMKDYIKTKYNYELTDFYVKPACVNLEELSLSKKKNIHLLNELKINKKRILVYAGKFGGSYLEDDFFQFCKEALSFWGDEFHLLLLSGHSKEEVSSYCIRNQFPIENITHLFVSPNKVGDYIGLADMAITPFKPVPSKRYGTPIKTGEYWAMGLPVFITPNISDDSEIIEKEDIGAVITTLNSNGYIEAIRKMDKILNENNPIDLQNKIRAIAEKYRNFSIAEKIYTDIYE